MRSKGLMLATGLGLAWSAGGATAHPAPGPGDDLFPAAYQVERALAGPPSAATSTPPESTRMVPRVQPPGTPNPRPRMAPPANARGARERLESYPKVAPSAAPAPVSAPRRTVAATLSTNSGGVPNYVAPSSRGALSRLIRSGEPDVPPGLPRGAARRDLVAPESLAARSLAEESAASVATTSPGQRAVDPLLAPRPLGSDRDRREPVQAELTARYAVDPLLAPRPLAPAPASDRTEALLSQIPPRSEDPLLAHKPLVMGPRPAPAAASPDAGRDPFTPIMPRIEAPPRDGVDPAATPALNLEPPPLIARRPLGHDQPLRRAQATPDDF